MNSLGKDKSVIVMFTNDDAVGALLAEFIGKISIIFLWTKSIGF